jgi:hypothetical protein
MGALWSEALPPPGGSRARLPLYPEIFFAHILKGTPIQSMTKSCEDRRKRSLVSVLSVSEKKTEGASKVFPKVIAPVLSLGVFLGESEGSTSYVSI